MKITRSACFAAGFISSTALSSALIVFCYTRDEPKPEPDQPSITLEEVVRHADRHPRAPDINALLEHGDWGVDQAVGTLRQGQRRPEAD